MAFKRRTRKLESSIVTRRNAAVRAFHAREARDAALAARVRADLATSPVLVHIRNCPDCQHLRPCNTLANSRKQ